jgi:cysteine-rich repeat protein
MRRRLLAPAVLVLLVGSPPTTAMAQVSAAGLDHPDLLDAFERFKPEAGDEVGAGTDSYADVFFGNEASGFAFFGGARGKLDGPDIGLVWFLFEPDTVKRSSSKITLSQKSQVGVAVPGVVDQAQPVEGCKAKVSVKGGPPPLDPESAKWSFSCKKDALAGLGLNSQQTAQLSALFGSSKSKLKNGGASCGKVPVCGNGVADCDEVCDEGGETATCDADCTFVACGDGETNEAAGEACDDGNLENGDGCDASCQAESMCGDGVAGPGEECDDGNTLDGDGCDANCILEACGNGVVQAGSGEECDDGNTVDGDGCSASCGLET